MRVEASHFPFNAERLAGKLWIPASVFFWFEPTGNRAQVFRLSSRRSIHSTCDRKAPEEIANFQPLSLLEQV